MKRVNSGQFTRERMLGSNNPKWRGDEVGYGAVHTWIYRTLGKAKVCSSCASIEGIQWANISGEYKRNLSDWKQLCRVCHRKFDGITKLDRSQVIEIKELYKKGSSQRTLAKAYGVSQMTISNLLRGVTKYYA